MESVSETELRKQVEELKKSRLQAARRCATGFGIISVLALMSLVYAYVQYNAGQRMSDQADKERQQAITARDEALRQVSEAEIAMKRLEQLTIELEICKASKK